MDFSEALRAAKDGKRIGRAAWKPGEQFRGCWMELVPASAAPDGRQCMEQLMIGYADSGILRPFAGANWDLLADDWEIAPHP